MKKNPIHFYWGRKNGLVVTREDAEGNHPEVVFVSNQLSLDKLKRPVSSSWPDCSCSGASADWYAALPVIIKRELTRSLYENSRYRIQLR